MVREKAFSSLVKMPGIAKCHYIRVDQQAFLYSHLYCECTDICDCFFLKTVCRPNRSSDLQPLTYDTETRSAPSVGDWVLTRLAGRIRGREIVKFYIGKVESTDDCTCAVKFLEGEMNENISFYVWPRKEDCVDSVPFRDCVVLKSVVNELDTKRRYGYRFIQNELKQAKLTL